MDPTPTPTPSSSHAVLITLISISLLASLGTMGLIVRGQNRADLSQQQLVSALVLLRSNVPSVPSTPTVQEPSTIPQANTATSVTSGLAQQSALMPPADEWGTIVHDGVSISYPTNLSVTTYPDEFTGGQTNLRISSSAVRKLGVDSTSFRGYELIIRQVDDKQYDVNRKEGTINPRVSSIVEMCDGSTCPDAQYIFVKNGKRYLIEALYQMSPYEAGVNLNERIIASIK